MNKKGFTLVELLAVVVVLAILSLLVIPVVSGIIENAKKGAVKSSAEGLLRAADMYYARHMDRMKEPVEFEINDGIQVSEEKLDYNGNIKMGYLMLFSETKKAVCVDDGTYSAYKGVNDKRIEVIEGICTGEYDSETESYIVSQTSKGFTNLSIKSYTDANKLPKSGNTNDIAIITETKITGYYVSSVAPTDPDEGMVWVVQSNNSPYYLESAHVRIGVSYAMQYEKGKWVLKHAYVYNDGWKLLYYVDMTDGNINLENSNLGDIEIENTYEYTGEYQEFTATFSGYYNIQLWGAQGQTRHSNTYPGGYGAYTKGEIYLNAGETIYIYVGGTSSNYAVAGWNGGGVGHNVTNYYGAAGGGATDVRLEKTSDKNVWNEFESLKSRIMVAAGGGGSGFYNNGGTYYYTIGGAGGGLIGKSGSKTYSNGGVAVGGSQTFGGHYNNSYLGGFGYGGNSTSGGGNGAGGGYYGGGAYNTAHNPSSGGSSYISGYAGCNSIEKESTNTNILHTGSAYHYSGYYFVNTKMIDGNGYEWNDASPNVISYMPTYDGSSTMVGNSGNGYAKIKLLNIELKTDQELNEYVNATEKKWYYSYSNSYQVFESPKNGIYNIQLWGAQGQTRHSNTYPGGKGAYTSGDIYLNKGERIYVYVGGTSSNYAVAGWNGGGVGTNKDYYYGAAGGGATDIRLISTSDKNVWNEFESLKSRIMVAAGGGGSGFYNNGGTYYYTIGGAGGGLIGKSGSKTYSNGGVAVGGSQTFGGHYNNSYLGGFGYGGNSTSGGGNGAGGGYYGGGAYNTAHNPSSGGSSYISGYTGCNSILKNSTISNIIHTGSPFHYSGYYFTNGIMVDGNGYSWNDSTTVTQSFMPTHDGNSTMQGNTGNGYAKITLLKSTTKDETQLDNYILENSNYNYYTYSGTYQIFDVSKNGTYRIELWGAQGQTRHSNTYPGGKGAYTAGEIELSKGTKLYIYIGGTPYSYSTGGWNGGGSGANTTYYYGAAGGGATDIRTFPTTNQNIWNENNSLKTRIMVAAGGGGSGYYNNSSTYYYATGGAGGGLIGYTGSSTHSNNYSIAGNQISAGKAGGFGFGGNATGGGGNGGGSGWYGGGEYNSAHQPAASGSSYISGHAGCIGVNFSSDPKVDVYSDISDSISYTGYKFTNTVMIDGNGYSWTTEKESSSSGMPSTTSSALITGNTGNGYARITYLGN